MDRVTEFWRAGGSTNSTSVEMARAVEGEGWDGQVFMDSQSLGADPYVLMGAWAMATERLKLSTGVTNPQSRHIAVTAGAAVTLQQISRGRAVLGIGRGDSALAYLGYGPVSLATFRRALSDLQTLLTGGEIAFEPQASATSLHAVSPGHRPTGSRLKWLPHDLPKVPLDVAASGPRVIEMAAVVAERATFSVGALPARVQWAIDVARAARKERMLSDHGISYGAQIIVICHPDREAMMPLATSFVAPLARFQVIGGAPVGPMSASDEVNLAAVRGGYDMTKHAEVDSKEKIVGTTLTRDFVERFAIVGPPDYCIERLLQLRAAGLDRFVIVGPGFHPEATYDGGSLFAREVIPAIRAADREAAPR
jgi:5,10-methylenetetrahydromethanopterin reductase